MNNLFELHEYTKNMKARIAIFSLKGKANIWWEDVKWVRDITTKELSWHEFKRLFKKKYLSERYPSSRINDLFDQLKRVAVFSNIDLRYGYHQVCIEEDIYKTTFRTKYGNYEFVVVSFSFPNALATFMCLINGVLHLYLDKFFIVFIDDILLYAKNEEEHVEKLAAVLRLLREHQLYANLNKCSFFQNEIHYLGYVVSKEGIAVDPKKIRDIMEWEAPRNVDEVRSFIELAGYYRRFIKNFS
eukprot:PITA_27065